MPDSASKMPANTSQDDPVGQDKAFITEKHGVWDVMFMNDGRREQMRQLLQDIPKSIPALSQLMSEIYFLSPLLCILYSISQLWSSSQSAINLHFSNQLLRTIEFCLKEGISDYWSVTYSTLMRLLMVSLVAIINWQNNKILLRLRQHVVTHFELSLMKAQLNRDLAQSGSALNETNFASQRAWHVFEELIRFVGWGLDVVSQLALIFHISRQNGSPWFILACVIKPIYSVLIKRTFWDKVVIVKKANRHCIRMEALTSLAKKKYRQEVIGNDLQGYIISEYKSASEKLGEISNEHPWTLLEKHESPFPTMLVDVLGDLPMVYCAVLAITNPQNLSFSSIVILKESSSQLGWSMETILSGMERFKKNLMHVRELYDIVNEGSERKATSSSEFIDYPPPATCEARQNAKKGMGFELRNVSFEYPGTQVSKKALTDINLTIEPGQFVVIVGANGSGKSTLVKLLARLYQPDANNKNEDDKAAEGNGPTASKILIDSLPASSYSERSLRRAMALLNQDNLIYPGFSLGENISLGYTPMASHQDAVMDAAEKAGAKEVLERMKEGTKTILDPLVDFHHFNVRDQKKDHPMRKLLEDMRRTVEVSGGEKQRIVAARTFMRFNSGNIRFLAVDEPSSALDAEAEVLLLENLLKEREGKTIVVVTHRFGKLTRKADLIVCMKEGRIVEYGNHRQLMLLAGEYRKLYDIQASAFQDLDED